MTKAAVLQAVQTFLDPAQSSIPHLGTVYKALPKIANEQDLFNLQPAGAGTGAVIYCFIERQSEYRESFGGPTSGNKFRQYTMALLCIFKSDLETALDGQSAFDTFMDALFARIQSDRRAGTGQGGVVWQWGEGNAEGSHQPDMVFEYPVPKSVSGGVMLFQAIGRVTVLEYLANT